MSNKFIKKMKAQCLNMDMISTLPPNIIENILTLMPIKDALRTSILSRKWRYCWTTMPILVFDESLYEASKLCDKLKIYDLVNAAFHVLLSHKGPIEELKIDLAELKMVSEFDQIILYLSRINNVKRLFFELGKYYYKLPPTFFSLQRLELLQLSNCYFEPPITFHGFSGLKSLRFFNVRINPQILKRLLSNCSLLDEVCLSGYEEDIPRDKTFTFVELLSFVPLIVTLQISNDYMKYLATGSIPEKLPTSLVSLKNLCLDVCLMEQDEISSALCMIRSSPNLEGINFRSAYEKDLPTEKTFTFVELLSCVPLIETLQISKDYVKYLATGGIPKKLSTLLVNLKYLFLDVCLMEKDEISSALCIIRSSPNLEHINFLMRDNDDLPVSKTSMDLLDLQDNLSLNLDHLKIFEIENCSNLAIEIKLVELFMAKLEDAWIVVNDDVWFKEEQRMLRELVPWPHPRASASAEVIIERSEYD